MSERSIVVRLRAEASAFKREFAEATKAVEQHTQATEKASRRSKKATEEQTRSQEQASESTEQTSKRSESAAGRLVQSAEKNREAWDRAGASLLAFGTITTAALAGSVNAAVQWESQFAGVAKTVDATDAELEQIEGGLRQLARTLPSTHEEIAAVAEAAGQLGVATKDIIGFTRVMIDLGETTNLTADEAATSIAQLMNIMGTAPQDVSRLGASLVALGNNGASTERDIIQMAQRIAGAGKIVGLSEDQVLALANALASVGVEVEAGGTAISSVMTDIAKSVSEGGDSVTGFAKVAGMSAQEFSRAFKEDPAQAIVAFVEGLGKIDAAGGDVFKTLDDLGQKDVRVARALLSMAGAGDLLAQSLATGAQAWADNTALAEEAGKRYDTTAAKIEIARNNIRDAGISIGEGLTPALAGAAEGLSSVVGWFAQLPQPVQGATGALAGVVGVTSLAAGGFLLTFPRVIETVKAFRQLRDVSPGAASGLGKVAKAAGVAAAAIAVMVTAGQMQSGAIRTEGVGEATKALLDLADGAENAQGAVDALFAGKGGFSDTFWGNNIRDMEEAVRLLTRPDFGMRFDDVTSRILTFGSRSSTAAEQAKTSFESIDAALANMVGSGNADRAAAAVAQMGLSADESAQILPSYNDALATMATQQDLAAGTSTAAAGALSGLAGATAELTEAQIELVKDWSEADATFVDIYGAYDTLVQKNQDAAQATADSTSSQKDSWEDFYDGFSVNLDEYLAELQKMADDQAAWETNMLLLSGRVSQGVLDELARLGPEGAPLVAQLVTASDEQLAQLEGIYGERATNATNAFATTLLTAGPVLAEIGARYGQETAQKLAAELAAGTTTVEQIMADYRIRIESNPPTLRVLTDTADAQGKIDALIRTNTGRVIKINVNAEGVPLQNIQGQMTFRAAGGPVFGPGTETSDSIPARLSTNEHVWSAREVRGAGGHAAVARLRAAAATGALAVPRFAAGGSPGWTAPATAPTGPSLPPVQIVNPVGYDPDTLARAVVRRQRDALTMYQLAGRV